MRRPSLQRNYNTIDVCQQKKQRQLSPGPGQYDISLPIIKPSYEAIRKNNDVMIIKVNNHGQSANFKSHLDRFPQERQKSPGPASYIVGLGQKNRKFTNYKKHSQRYQDLLDFMYHDRSKIPAVPDYQVHYTKQYQESLRYIKNGHHKHKFSKSVMEEAKEIHSEPTTKSIIYLNSERRPAIEKLRNLQQSNSISSEYLDLTSSRTIDIPSETKLLRNSHRNLQEQDKQLLHRKTLYNRNMLGIIMSQRNKKK